MPVFAIIYLTNRSTRKNIYPTKDCESRVYCVPVRLQLCFVRCLKKTILHTDYSAQSQLPRQVQIGAAPLLEGCHSDVLQAQLGFLHGFVNETLWKVSQTWSWLQRAPGQEASCQEEGSRTKREPQLCDFGVPGVFEFVQNIDLDRFWFVSMDAIKELLLSKDYTVKV